MALFLQRQKADLTRRSHLDFHDHGLDSVAGADTVIAELRKHPHARHLVLGHNSLRDDGTIKLFKFLTTSKHELIEVSLNSNGISDEGLVSISEYLPHAPSLKALYLQSNTITDDTNGARAFAFAVNSSHLRILSLSLNPLLGDTFLEVFLAALHSHTLSSVQLSAISLSPQAVPYITEYLTSPRSKRVCIFKCSGNSLGTLGVETVVRAIEMGNFALTHVELYANESAFTLRDPLDPPLALPAPPVITPSWKEHEVNLRTALSRNTGLHRMTAAVALELLPIARALLLRPVSASMFDPARSSVNSSDPTSRFAKLPGEIQLHIISFLIPPTSLSPSQFIRVCNFAADPRTLPSLALPRIGTTLVRTKDEQRTRWLEEVACDGYDY